MCQLLNCPLIDPVSLMPQVCLRSSPMYHSGALAFATVDGVPKVGQLLESAWSLSDTCRFKILKQTPL